MPNVIPINRPPEPTHRSPYAQVTWVFFQVERENEEPTAALYRYGRSKYLEYLAETLDGSQDLQRDPRFHLHKQWDTSALIRFIEWLQHQKLASKTRYSIFKIVRRVMDFAYAMRVIDTMVYPPPVFKGVRETDSRTAYSEEAQEFINAALARWVSLAVSVLQGYQPTGQGIPYRGGLTVTSINLDGREIPVAEAARVYGVPHGLITGRIKRGWGAREAVGLDSRDGARTQPGVPQALVVEGKSYRSLSAAARAFGVSERKVTAAVQAGCSPEQALGLVPTRVPQGDERALLWAFENDYACDPLAMLSDFHQRRLSVVCTEKRMRTLFARWGVWPHIDDRLIMPLATELGVLTGLNVESLKVLETDCYQDEHGLTGEPVINYRKGRAASERRPEDQALQLAALEVEEVFITSDVAAKVKTLVNMILDLTARIRGEAPAEIARRLIIFVDVEASRSLGKRVVVGLDPRRKAAAWYGRFKREEGLLQSLGEKFRFNISRCRPTLVTNMVLGGATLLQVQTVVGHASIQTTVDYLDEHQLQPAFDREVSDAMQRIVRRSKGMQNVSPEPKGKESLSEEPGFSETLSGCGCSDPYSPSANVRMATKHIAGTVCKFWNMCLFCDQAIVTESSLPKIIIYRQRVKSALDSNSPAILPREQLFKDVVTLIDGILADDVIFPQAMIEDAKCKAAGLDDILVDQLIYQGI